MFHPFAGGRDDFDLSRDCVFICEDGEGLFVATFVGDVDGGEGGGIASLSNGGVEIELDCAGDAQAQVAKELVLLRRRGRENGRNKNKNERASGGDFSIDFSLESERGSFVVLVVQMWYVGYRCSSYHRLKPFKTRNEIESCSLE